MESVALSKNLPQIDFSRQKCNYFDKSIILSKRMLALTGMTHHLHSSSTSFI